MHEGGFDAHLIPEDIADCRSLLKSNKEYMKGGVLRNGAAFWIRLYRKMLESKKASTSAVESDIMQGI